MPLQKRPTFLVVGLPKCGTTALAHYLGQHPDVLLSTPKEPHFFDAHYDLGLDGYWRKHFGRWSGETAVGEATPTYLLAPWALERIARDLPEVRLIVMVRDPVKRLLSEWWMLHARGMEPLALEQAVAANLEKPDALKRLAEESWRDHVERLHRGLPITLRFYLEYGAYGDRLEPLFERFPAERLRVVSSDELKADSVGVVRSLWTFLGVDAAHELRDGSPQNEALGGGARPLLRAAQAVGLTRLTPYLPERFKARVKRQLGKLGSGRPEMPEDLKATLVDYYRPQVARLERLVGRSFEEWLK